ncbi:hypothetical protein [Amycolatopsis jiangsuensis]|uniref:Uncharacterized protein n=1 Tax=Amycolatopsis jiangsuensis TaxID=1181879 RepID=A0A840IYE3_9PSEU|nr:hypothetical protein [Amycolatopsis jiangsuensis]MBB4686713.1 hypothetical protein [Amycolatopsis jiangsuensis]
MLPALGAGVAGLTLLSSAGRALLAGLGLTCLTRPPLTLLTGLAPLAVLAGRG